MQFLPANTAPDAINTPYLEALWSLDDDNKSRPAPGEHMRSRVKWMTRMIMSCVSPLENEYPTHLYLTCGLQNALALKFPKKAIEIHVALTAFAQELAADTDLVALAEDLPELWSFFDSYLPVRAW